MTLPGWAQRRRQPTTRPQGRNLNVVVRMRAGLMDHKEQAKAGGCPLGRGRWGAGLRPGAADPLEQLWVLQAAPPVLGADHVCATVAKRARRTNATTTS